MLDDLAALELEDVDHGVASGTGLAHSVDMDDHVAAIGEDALDLAAVVGKAVLQEHEEEPDTFRSIRHDRLC
jgi:hypothetical protein